MKIILPRMRARMVMVLIAIYVLLLIATLYKGASFLLMIVLMVWFYLLMLSISDIKNNIAYFCYLISFYVFLIGREVGFDYFSVEVYYKYLTGENNFAYCCLLISLLGIGVGNFIYTSRTSQSNVFKMDIKSDVHYIVYAQKITKYGYYFCYLFSIIVVAVQIIMVRKIGYLASYTDEASVSGVPGIVFYIGAFTPTIFCLFLATYPSKNSAILPIVLYEIYGVLTILAGKRYPFIAISMIILIYLVIRNKSERGWITRKMIIAVIIALPLLLIFLSLYDSIRLGEEFTFTGILNTIIHFFDEQGGSINVIKRVKYYENEIKDLTFCSFENTRSVLFENLIMRRFTGIEVFSGNSIERAMNGNSLMHRLSYYTYGNAYLSGRGVGSCYIAELFHDFSYIGIFIGSTFLGQILRLVSNMKFSNYIKDGIMLAIMYYILLAPRGNFDGFVGGVFSLYSLLGIFAVYILVMLVRGKS